MKITIIGPLLPFRSGIARHTTALARDLERRAAIDLKVYSFARQYPKLLYPGEDDNVPGGERLHDIEVDYCLDSVNPLTWRRVVRQIHRQDPDLVLLPVWTFFLAPCLGSIARSLRARGIKVAMVVHNAIDHEASGWKKRLFRFQLRQAHHFVTHNEAIAEEVEDMAPGRPITIRPHPVFDDYPPAKGSLQRRGDLELLFFGLVRPYKGLNIALRAMGAAKRKDIHLSVVGEFWQNQEETEELIATLGLEGRVDIVPGYASDQDAAEHFSRCDAVILPYRSASASGVIALAYWFERPVVVSDLPSFRDLVQDEETGWKFPAGDEHALAALLEGPVNQASALAMRPKLVEAKEDLSWTRFVDKILKECCA